MWQSVEILKVFNTLTLKQIFWKTEIFLKKLEHHFLVESTKIKNASFPYKTAISEANVKTNRMVSSKWTYHKGRSFASNYFIFWKFCFSLRTSYKELIWCTNDLMYRCAKRLPSLKCASHILQWRNLAQLCYTLPKADAKNIWITWHTPLPFFSPKISTFCYIKKHRYKSHFGKLVFKDCFNKYGYNLDDFSNIGYSRPS